MTNRHTHFVTTTDGVEIGGVVHGQGPPLVFLPGGVGDSDLDWGALLPYVTGRFTCYLPSLRGRGLSGDHPDLGRGRLVDDLVAYVDSIGETTGLVDWSAGGMVLAVAAQSDAVGAVGAVEPAMFSANHVPDATLREISGAGHASPLTHPATVAEAVAEFFLPTQQPN